MQWRSKNAQQPRRGAAVRRAAASTLWVSKGTEAMAAARTYGRWKVVESLGEGGQAHTFLIEDGTGGIEGRLVLKRLKNPKRLGRFEQEVAALQRIESAHIPRVIDYSLAPVAFLVTPYLGVALPKAMETLRWNFDRALDIFRDVVQAAADAHGVEVAHRDIKPDNIVVTGANGDGPAFLIDFGICQFLDGQLFLTTEDEPLGSRLFSAPELEPGSAGEPGAKSDVYSLGKVLFWLLSGGKILHREQVEQQIDEIPDNRGVARGHVVQLLRRTVVANPHARMTAAELLSQVVSAGASIRSNVNRVGSTNQLCPICRIGRLRRIGHVQAHNMGGFTAVGNPPDDRRTLHCSHCGWLQQHYIAGTTGERSWEI